MDPTCGWVQKYQTSLSRNNTQGQKSRPMLETRPGLQTSSRKSQIREFPLAIPEVGHGYSRKVPDGARAEIFPHKSFH